MVTAAPPRYVPRGGGHDVNVDPVDDGAASRFAQSFTVSNAGLRPNAVKLQLG